MVQYGKIEWFDGLSRWTPVPLGGRFKNRLGTSYMGQPTVESAIAHHPTTQGGVIKGGVMVLSRAKAIHTTARLSDPRFDRGRRTYIESEYKKPDYLVMLTVDTSVDPGVEGATGGNPIAAAMAVEYGHRGTGYGPGPFQIRGRRYPGKFILHKAIGKTPTSGVR